MKEVKERTGIFFLLLITMIFKFLRKLRVSWPSLLPPASFFPSLSCSVGWTGGSSHRARSPSESPRVLAALFPGSPRVPCFTLSEKEARRKFP
jgi:hypothetical protein